LSAGNALPNVQNCSLFLFAPVLFVLAAVCTGSFISTSFLFSRWFIGLTFTSSTSVIEIWVTSLFKCCCAVLDDSTMIPPPTPCLRRSKPLWRGPAWGVFVASFWDAIHLYYKPHASPERTLSRTIVCGNVSEELVGKGGEGGGVRDRKTIHLCLVEVIHKNDGRLCFLLNGTPVYCVPVPLSLSPLIIWASLKPPSTPPHTHTHTVWSMAENFRLLLTDNTALHVKTRPVETECVNLVCVCVLGGGAPHRRFYLFDILFWNLSTGNGF